MCGRYDALRRALASAVLALRKSKALTHDLAITGGMCELNWLNEKTAPRSTVQDRER